MNWQKVRLYHKDGIYGVEAAPPVLALIRVATGETMAKLGLLLRSKSYGIKIPYNLVSFKKLPPLGGVY